jgi:Tfp pilus assembly protein PilX
MDIKNCPRCGSSRRGAFTTIVLICLVLAGMLLASLLKLALMQQRQSRYEQARLQAAWLALSGLDRAAARLALEAGYAGETWNVEPARLGGADSATVIIRVERVETEANRRTVVVEAVYPAEGPHQARLTRQAILSISRES